MAAEVKRVWYSTRELADRYGFTVRAVEQWITRGLNGGKLPAVKVGRHWRVRRSDWRAFLAFCRGDRGAPPALRPAGARQVAADRKRCERAIGRA